MDDRLQRRLEAADPLAAGVGTTPDPARLDAIKEHIMQTESAPSRGAVRPRAIGLVGLAAASLAVVLVAGSLLRPAATLAWDPSPTPVTAAQRDAATKACAAGLPAAIIESREPAPVQGQPDASGLPQLAPGGNLPSGGDVGVTGTADASAITVTTGTGPASSMPAMPAAMPPLVGLELHGTGAVAIFADAKLTAYCLLVKDGDGFSMAALLFPDLGGGASAAVGSIGSSGSATGMATAGVGANGVSVTALSAAYKDQEIGIIAGLTPSEAARVKVVGGPADGATASVADGRFAMWAPGNFLGEPATLQVLDAAGKVIASQELFAQGGQPPMVTSTTAP